VLASLHDAGFDDILPAQLGVFQSPGPDGQRPTALALRTQTSKQSMNHLLQQLETDGYLTRQPPPGVAVDVDSFRVIRLTELGWAASNVIWDAVARLDREWRQFLGGDAYHSLANALDRPWGFLDRQDLTRP
jgi:DNA-binding MarR family transcriptional regulator